MIAQPVGWLDVGILMQSALRERNNMINRRPAQIHRLQAQSADPLILLPEFPLVDVLHERSQLPRSSVGW